jgi:hypothetical protein
LGLQFLQQLLDLLVVAFRLLNALDLVMLLSVNALHSLDVHAQLLRLLLLLTKLSSQLIKLIETVGGAILVRLQLAKGVDLGLHLFNLALGVGEQFLLLKKLVGED